MGFYLGPVVIRFRSPVVVYRREPKQWLCVQSACPEAYAQPRRLTKDGRCPRCGHGLKRGGALALFSHVPY